MKQPLIVLTGPTASGKTALSIGLAKAIGGEIISADSMQVYRQMAFLPQDSCGAIRSLTGTRWQKMIMHGGLEESIISVIFMMY